MGGRSRRKFKREQQKRHSGHGGFRAWLKDKVVELASFFLALLALLSPRPGPAMPTPPEPEPDESAEEEMIKQQEWTSIDDAVQARVKQILEQHRELMAGAGDPAVARKQTLQRLKTLRAGLPPDSPYQELVIDTAIASVEGLAYTVTPAE